MAKQNKNNKTNFSDVAGYVAIVLIVVSIFFIGMKITGYAAATDTATVNVTVSSSGAINFTTDNVNFGTGAVDSGKIALLNTEGSTTNGTGFTTVNTPLSLENIGNVNVTLLLSSSSNASNFIGGNNPSFKIKVSDKTSNTGACVGNTVSSYTELTTANLTICSPLQFYDDKDEIDINIQLSVPSDSNTGAQSTTITATGTYA